ncbi:MAG TPA: oligosaccharide flippase family protein, partial [Isosphaeraceae bacterium]|nr:oligosaccharide flippase family protein [Isosphaeraceae bacterium]
PLADGRRAVRDSLIVTVGGQLEQVAGTVTSFALRWMLRPAQLGIYTYLRLFLDNTNRSSLGISLGAVQEIPILRAAGRESAARRVADVAYTTNTLTCLVYASGLALWALWRAPVLAGEPFATDYTGGLAAVAALAFLKRYQDFLIAVLRAHQEFALTTTLAVLDALIFAVAAVAGIALAGVWGLWGAVGLLFLFNIIYLHAKHPLRFRWAWDWRTAARLMRVGLPILANTAVFGALLNVDSALIVWLMPDGPYWTGVFTIALMGTSWGLDLAGRIALVMYTYFQTTMGRTRDPVAVARQAARVVEAQAPVLAAGGSVAYLVGPVFLGLMLPRYAPGLPALRPLLPGMILLGLAWPARQMLITVDRPYRLCLATLLGLALATVAGAAGAGRAGIVGVAEGMTIAFASVYLLTSATAFAAALGPAGWLLHQARVALTLGWFSAGALLAAHVPLPIANRWAGLAARCVILLACDGPPRLAGGRRNAWGGVFDRKTPAETLD